MLSTKTVMVNLRHMGKMHHSRVMRGMLLLEVTKSSVLEQTNLGLGLQLFQLVVSHRTEPMHNAIHPDMLFHVHIFRVKA